MLRRLCHNRRLGGSRERGSSEALVDHGEYMDVERDASDDYDYDGLLLFLYNHCKRTPVLTHVAPTAYAAISSNTSSVASTASNPLLSILAGTGTAVPGQLLPALARGAVPDPDGLVFARRHDLLSLGAEF